MEEKKVIEEQAAEQTTSQENISELDTIKAENAELKKQLSTAQSSLDWNRKQYLEKMNMSEILKKTLTCLCERKQISKAEMYEAMMTANDMDLDVVLSKLAN